MAIDLQTWKAGIASGYVRLFGGRMARATFALRAAILISVLFIISVPTSTILAASSKTLRDAYGLASFILAIFCLVGLVSAYVRRLHDIGLRGYWAIAALILLPAAISASGFAYSAHRYSLDDLYDGGLNDLLGYAALIAPFLIAMWRGDRAENRFGPVPPPIEHALTSRFSVAATIGAVIILIPTCIYAGLFQSGVWVGRGGMGSPMPIIDSNRGGTRFMKCWNVKGVGAGNGEGSMGGVYRDGYEDTVFDFIVTPGGQIDIATAGKTVGKSYLADGFRIVPYGLKLPADGSGYISVRGLDRFMLVAIFDQGGEDAAINYTTFAFAKDEDSWPEFNMIMSTGLSQPTLGGVNFPKARGKLMIGDCMAG